MKNGGIGVREAPTDKPTSDTDKSKAEKDLPKPESATTGRPPAPPTNETYRHRRRSCCYTRDPAMLGVTFLTFIAVVVYAYYARQQACSANRTANAAIAANKLATDREELELRPYLFVPVMNPKRALSTSNAIFDVAVAIKNYGKTPGIAVGIARGVQAVQVGAHFSVKCPTGDSNEVQSRSTIPPDETYDVTDFIKTLSVNDVMDVVSTPPRKHLYFYGCLTYQDVFQCSHLTFFCGIYNPVTNDFRICSQDYFDYQCNKRHPNTGLSKPEYSQ